MHRTLPFWSVTALALLTPHLALAAEYFVAPSGNDDDPGTMSEPFATLQRAHDAVSAGDTVHIRGGTYRIVGAGASSAAGILLTKSGTSDTNRIKFWAYPGEVPVFDFAEMTISTTGYTSGFSVTGSFLHIKGLEIKNVPMNTRSNTGMTASGSNNIFELLNLHHNNGTGLFLRDGGGNLILNCDSHDNYDPTSSQGRGQNADGFGVHYQESGPVNVIRGCRAWWNSDDGYDYISQEVPVITEHSWAMGNGYIESGTARGSNGNGFKVGSSKTGIRHVVRNCLSWGNAASGFYANHSSAGNDWYNNTAYDNGTQFNMLASIFHPDGTRTDGVTLTGDKVHRMRNNVGFPDDNTNMNGVDSAFNSWDLELVPSDDDFESVADTGFMGPRLPDGSLPALEFMKLRAGSKLVDAGTDVGLDYAGGAPDLGCYETGLPGAGTGGAAGTAGVGGTNGAAGSAGDASGGSDPGNGGVSGGAMTGGAAGSDAAGGASTGGAMNGGASTGGAMNGGGSSGGAMTGGAAGTAMGGSVSGGAGVGASGGASGAGSPGSGGASAGVAGMSDSPRHEDESGEPGCQCGTARRAPVGFGSALAAGIWSVLAVPRLARSRRRRRNAVERD